MKTFLAELRRRNVIRMAGLYLVGAWLVVQVAETLLPIFGTPDWVLRTLVVLLGLGLVPALVFSWIYELTPEGLKRDAEVTPEQSFAIATGKRMDRLLLVGMLLVLAAIVADRFWPQGDGSTMGSESTFAGESTQIAPQSGAKTESDPEPSVAVLPFANLSSDPEQEYFSDGMTEELLNVLAKIPGLKVAARTSVFEFKGKGGDVREIGAKLGVSHLVEGSVRRDGEAIRVTAQLIRVADGFHVWSETYDRKLESVFALQDDLANRVGSALQVSLGVAAPAARSSIDPAAYDHYLKGRALLRARRDIPTAITHFQTALALAPDFAAGWSSLSLTLEVGYWYIDDLDADARDTMLVQQAAAAERAAALDPDSAAVYHALGNVARKRFKFAEAERNYVRAMEIDPGYPDVREDYAELLFQVGRTEEAMQAARQLVALDPFFGIGWVRLYEIAARLDLPEEVDLSVRKLAELMPQIEASRLRMLDYALEWRRADQARAALEEMLARADKHAGFAQTLLPWALGEADLDPETLREALNQAPVGERAYYLMARVDVEGYNAHMQQAGATMQGFYFSNMNARAEHGRMMLRDPRVKAELVRYGFVDYWRAQGWPASCRPSGDADFECGLDTEGAR